MFPVLFLIGMHGCGKTTVGRMLEAQHGFRHVSLGDLGRLARQRKINAEYSLRLWCLLAGQTPDKPLREPLVVELLESIHRLRQRSPVSVDGFPSAAAHLSRLPSASTLVFLDVPDQAREERLILRSANGPRKWTPGLRSVRDEMLTEVLQAAGERVHRIDASPAPQTVVERLLATVAMPAPG